MTDRYDENLILGYVENELSPDERSRFETMLAQDPALRELTQGLAGDRASLRAMPREQPPAEILEDVMQTLERSMLLGDARSELVTESPDVRRFRLGRVLAYTGLAAMLLLTGGIFLTTLTDVDLLDEAGRRADVGEWFEAGGERQRDRLADARESRAERERRAVEREADDAAPAAAPTAAIAAAEADAHKDESDSAAAGVAGPAGTLASKAAGPATVDAGRAASPAPAEPAPTTAADATALAAAPSPEPIADFMAQLPAGLPAAPAPSASPLAEADQPPDRVAAAEPPVTLENNLGGAIGFREPLRTNATDPDIFSKLADRAVSPGENESLFSNSLPPNARIQIVARDTGAARQDVVTWAIQNRAGVTPAPPEPAEVLESMDFAAEQPALQSMKSAPVEFRPAETGQTRILVQIRDEQLPQFLATLNSRPGQRAGLVQSPEIVRRPANTNEAEGNRPRTVFSSLRDDVHPQQRALLTPPVQSYADSGSGGQRELRVREPSRYQYPEGAKLPGGALAGVDARQAEVQQLQAAQPAVEQAPPSDATLAPVDPTLTRYGLDMPFIGDPETSDGSPATLSSARGFTIPVYITEAPASEPVQVVPAPVDAPATAQPATAGEPAQATPASPAALPDAP